MNTQSGKQIRRVVGATAAMAALVGAVASVAGASNIHYLDGPTFSERNGAVTASGTVAGLGNKDVSVSLVATVTTTCTNRGGNVPPGQTENVQGFAGGLKPKNGSLSFSVTTATAANPCPAPMKPIRTVTSATLTLTHGRDVLVSSWTP